VDADAIAVLEARWRLREVTPSDLLMVADGLLSEAVESPSLIALFALTPDEALWRGPDLFENALRELGGGSMDRAQAASALARHLARQVLDGSISPEEMTSRAMHTYIRNDYQLDEFAQLYGLNEEIEHFDRDGLSYLGRTYDEVVEDVREEARRLLAT
jgi:hypothetical protein